MSCDIVAVRSVWNASTVYSKKKEKERSACIISILEAEDILLPSDRVTGSIASLMKLFFYSIFITILYFIFYYFTII